jgi:HPt (histidine-containing phosphotransfer) domain-containing protein
MSNRITDLTFLQSFTGGNRDKMNKYINIFLQMCPGQLDAMQSLLASANYDALRATAHSLKPQITYMGIKQGEGIIKTIEQYAGEKINTEQLPELFKSFKEICEKAIVELQQEVNNATA